MNEIIFMDTANHMIVFREQSVDFKTNNDYEKAENLEEISVMGYSGTSYIRNSVQYVTVITDNSVLGITCDDNSVDLVGFAKKIEKR